MPFGRLLKVAGSRSPRLPLLLECLLCKDKFTVPDVDKKQFFISTSICRKCYAKGAVVDPQVWCFGKRQRGNSPGYSEENVGCRLLCPDKKVCKLFIKLNKEKVK
jgi:NAD-dependent SIR2 family protein deacetylase